MLERPWPSGWRFDRWQPAKLRSTRRIYAETGLAEDGRDLDRLVSGNAAYTVAYYGRLARSLESAYRRKLLRTIRPTDLRHLTDARQSGRGLILVAPHLGDFDLAVAWIADAIGDAPVVPVADLGRPWAQRAFGAARRACGFELVSSSAATLPALTAELRKGRAVILTLDRRSGARTLEVTFFGRPARLPAGCLSLARESGAPLLSVATWNESGERVLAFGEPLGPGTDSEGDRDEVLLQRLSSEVEAAIRAAPQQWHIPARLDELSFLGGPPIDRRLTCLSQL